jgi:hypothetical protein
MGVTPWSFHLFESYCREIKLSRDCCWLCGDAIRYRNWLLLFEICFEVIFVDLIDQADVLR